MKIKVGVFFGGKSVEHEVSVITAIQAIENMDKEKYDVVPIYIAKDNRMYCGEKIGDISNYSDIDKLLKDSTQIMLAQKDKKVAILRCDKKIYQNEVYDYIDIAFPIVHGSNVEDGTIEGFLKMFNIPYVGSDVISSGVCMDKYFCKCILKDNQIPVLDCICISTKDYNDDSEKVLNEVEAKFSYPVIVKPVNLGSSVGIKLARNHEELMEGIENASMYSRKLLVERAIKNLKEVNCSVVGDYESAKASECEEPVKTDEILSYKDKYVGGGKKMGATKSMNASVLKLPADIDDDVKARIQELALKTFHVIDCSGVIRIDFMIDQDANEIFVNEINSIPGSLSFHLWRATNLEYTKLLDELIDLALKRDREEKNITNSFDSNILSGISMSGLKGGTKAKLNN